MFKLIITIKNRLNHFLKTFPFMVSQYGSPYELVLVNFHSNDNFEEALKSECEFRKDTFSPYLQKIRQVKLLEDLKFNPRKARNLGAAYCKDENTIFFFSDADTFLGMTYVSFWHDKIKKGETFVVTRRQESRANLPCRIEPEINYGNFIVHSSDYYSVNGFDERYGHYGGDDDDIYHRLKLLGLKEINPYDRIEARQYSILHDDELRLSQMEVTSRIDNKKEFERIYNNTNCFVNDNKFINIDRIKNISMEEVIYEK
tara:strand:- start:229 stop:1002 length:774 start_codon:yes stop_codon:yes gene_type:complete